MRLNPDCIRDILLYVEENTDAKIESVNVDSLHEKLSKYDSNTLFYHIRKMDSANFFDDVYYADNEPQEISSLSWHGHEFIENIREDKNWNETKSIAKKIGSQSVTALTNIASNLIAALIKSHLQI